MLIAMQPFPSIVGADFSSQFLPRRHLAVIAGGDHPHPLHLPQVCAQGNPLSFILVGAAFEQTDVQHCKQLYGQVCAQFQPLLVGHGVD